jgi:hypothetical protein
MATRVLATPEAAAAIGQIENILNSGLTETMQSLNQQGGILSEPNVWDRNLADDFRGNVWAACWRALANAHTPAARAAGEAEDHPRRHHAGRRQRPDLMSSPRAL